MIIDSLLMDNKSTRKLREKPCTLGQKTSTNFNVTLEFVFYLFLIFFETNMEHNTRKLGKKSIF